MTAALLPADFVLGDGTTPGGRALSRWRRWRWATTIGIAVLVVITAMALIQPQTNAAPYSIGNADANGTRAVAQILRQQGASVTEVEYLVDAGALLHSGDTLVIAPATYLSDAQLRSINEFDGTVVWLGPRSEQLWALPGTMQLSTYGGAAARTPGCLAPAAIAAEEIVSELQRDIAVTNPVSATQYTCFMGSSPDSGAYVYVERDGNATHVLVDPSLVTNARLADRGNAALSLHMLGASDTVVWYRASVWDDTLLKDNPEEGGGPEFLANAYPTWLLPALGMLVLAALVLALVQGRRMGPLVTEPLPVIVRASETTRGRARLYRRGKSYGHAGAALRAGSAGRIARLLGVMATAAPDTLLGAIAAATTRDPAEVSSLLYGPPPHDEASLRTLVTQLDALESEVHPR